MRWVMSGARRVFRGLLSLLSAGVRWWSAMVTMGMGMAMEAVGEWLRAGKELHHESTFEVQQHVRT